MKKQILSCSKCGFVNHLPKKYNSEYSEAIHLIIVSYHLAEKSTPANLRRAIENAEKMINGDDYEK